MKTRLIRKLFPLILISGLAVLPTSCKKKDNVVSDADAKEALRRVAEAQAKTQGGPKLSGSYTGRYTHRTPAQTMSQVDFRVTIDQAPGSRSFTGVVDEPYTNFGTPKDGRLWADITGTCTIEGDRVRVLFQKVYRHFDQPAVSYQGTVPVKGGVLSGTWAFPTDLSNGEFSIDGFRP